MLFNVTETRLVIGRINVLPGEKVPAVPMTKKEEAGIEALKKKGFLAEKPGVHKSEVAPKATEAPKVAEATKVEASKAESPKPSADDKKAPAKKSD